MGTWGFSYSNDQKDVYFDGHEGSDIIAYRKSFVERMCGYIARMESYTGDQLEITVPPVLPDGLKKVVIITHDESTYYANDGKEKNWYHTTERQIREKSMGRSIMVST